MNARRASRRSLWLRRGGGVALLTALLSVVGIAPAAAHPYLLRSDPAAGSILTAAPQQIDIDYTEGLDRSYCNVVLTAPDGTKVQTHQVTANGPAELSVVPNHPLDADGTYAVNWTAVGDDGHTVIGNFGFSIGHPSANPAVTTTTGSGTGSATSPGGVRRLLQTVLPFATVIFAGLLLLSSVLAGAGRRAARIRFVAFGLQAGFLAALAVTVLTDGGASTFVTSATGQRLLAELALTLLAVPLLVDRGQFSAGERPGGARRWLGVLIAVGLLALLAASGHAASQPSSRRALVLCVYSIHLIAVSTWLGSLVSVALLPDRRRGLRALVWSSLLAVVATGVATTDWGLRTLHDVPDTLYGRLAITKASLFLLIVLLGAGASWWQLRRGNARTAGRLVRAEVIVGGATLIVAGVLGQIAQPLEQPYPSQAYAAQTGLPVSVTSAGDDSLGVATLAPGITGRNTLIVEVGDNDEQDFLSPATDVHSVTATVSCGCGEPDQEVALQPTGHGAAWTGDVTLATPASWLVTAKVRRGDQPAQTVELAQRVSSANLPHQVVIGVPASLSGTSGETCRDEVLGLQTALADLNTSAADHGDLMRVVAVDLHDGTTAALARLRGLGARMIAMPCGTSTQVAALTDGARSAGLPVVLGSGAGDTTAAGVWSTQPSWRAEGAAIGDQAITQHAAAVTAIVGASAVDRAELAGLRSRLGAEGIAVQVKPLPSAPVRFVARLARRGAGSVAVLADRGEALPLMQAFSAVSQDAGWTPPQGILASAQLMSTDFINDAGTITRLGGVEFASSINPFDPVAQYYAQRLRALTPGIRPTFDGLHGYQAGVAIAKALAAGGGDPSAPALTRLLGEQLHDFTLGSYHLGWQPDGGTSTALAFFRTTYINPMAMPVDAPGGASSLAHEGTFLDSGGFEQVAPFRRLD
ncbi:MAG: copper resistance protein CopC [Frankiaceae bacterium]|nr:copper resistance protein CopC [Frankiaceae bacterium]MBV9871399.1 copper resistance protein CopC [Frankiaceae bacterium]